MQSRWQGLLGAAAAAAQHPWLTSGAVRGMVNLEAMGSGGRSQLFRATPDAAWLLRAFVGAAPAPAVSAAASDVFNAGVVNSDTDVTAFRAVARPPWPALDFAFLQRGAATLACHRRAIPRAVLAQLLPGSCAPHALQRRAFRAALGTTGR